MKYVKYNTIADLEFRAVVFQTQGKQPDEKVDLVINELTDDSPAVVIGLVNKAYPNVVNLEYERWEKEQVQNDG